MPKAPACCFRDMLEAIDLKARDKLIATADQMTVDKLRKVFRVGSILQPTIYCVIHQRECFCTKAQVHVAGTECVDFAKNGLRLGTAGKGALALWAWFSQRRAIQDFAARNEVSTQPQNTKAKIT